MQHGVDRMNLPEPHREQQQQKRAFQDKSAQNDSSRESAKRSIIRSGPAASREPSVSPVRRTASRLRVLSCVPIRLATNCQLRCGRFTEAAFSRTSQVNRSLTRRIPFELTPRRQCRRIVDGSECRRPARCWTVLGGGTLVRAQLSKCRSGAGIDSFLHALLPERSKSGDYSRRTPQRGREACHNLVLEENSLDGDGGEMPKVGRVRLGDENDGQERMIS